MRIGQAIKTMRQKRHEMQNVFAGKIGITQTYLSQLENDLKTPSIELLERISSIMNIPFPILFWFSITELDIHKEKRENYKFLKPIIDEMLNSLICDN